MKKRAISLILAFCMLVALLPTITFAATSDGYGYRVLSDGTVEISSYSGKGGKVTIPSTIDGMPVTRIGEWAFSGWEEGLTSVTIPEGVTHIGESAFDKCFDLKNVSIPESVVYIGADSGIPIPSGHSGDFFIVNDILVRYTGTSLDVVIPDGVKSISSAFSENYPLWGEDGVDLRTITSVSIPNSVASIGDRAFWTCFDLEEVKIPYGVTSIGDGAFFLCRNLKSITIPATVTYIGDNAFSGEEGWNVYLKSVNFEGKPPQIGEEVFHYADPDLTLYYPAIYVFHWAPNGETTWNGYRIAQLGSERNEERAEDWRMREECLQLLEGKYSEKEWKKATKNGRKEMLISLFNDVKEILNLSDSWKIYFEELGFFYYGKTDAYLNENTNEYENKVIIADKFGYTNYYLMMRTVIHECRHAYQREVILGENDHIVSDMTRQKWLDSSLKGKYIHNDSINSRPYFQQAVEWDAYYFAGQENKLKGKTADYAGSWPNKM
ncbi:leucine-rich repeat domain-containing protein [Eubacteriales bacterium OttesenSCG-928-K08]|nr:leucine-rich repeat domain-containing protein [Eubacteriales bacterium OttesenSCG-928-K08]